MKDLKGQKFGKLTVIEFSEIRSKYAYWRCVCDCGREKIARGANLISGQTQSCGCLNYTSHTKLRDGKSRIYVIWVGMKQRCENSKRIDYAKYGGRGIRVCNEWHDYLAFCDWARANGYDESKSIERINNNGDYSPDNCQWVDYTVQQNNKRNSFCLTVDGETRTAAEWSKISGIPSDRIRKRKRSGWTDRDAVFEPLDYTHQHKITST